MVFFPITALAKMFDLKYSSTKIAYGYLLRIRDDNAVLSDEYFIDAATDPIQKRYAQYERAHAAAEQENETPAQVDTPMRRDDLTGLSAAARSEAAMLTQLLSTLENYQSHATLLLTPELLESVGDGVRRAAATGNAVALRIDAGPPMRRSRRSNGATTRCGAPQACARGSSISKARTRRCARRSAGQATVPSRSTRPTLRAAAHWADTALKWAGRSTSVRLYLGAESGCPPRSARRSAACARRTARSRR